MLCSAISECDGEPYRIQVILSKSVKLKSFSLALAPIPMERILFFVESEHVFNTIASCAKRPVTKEESKSFENLVLQLFIDCVEQSFCVSVLLTLEISFASSPIISLNGKSTQSSWSRTVGLHDPLPFSTAILDSVELRISELQPDIGTGPFF